MKFTFTATEEGGTNIVQTFETDYIDTVVEHMEHFLRGCGFYPRGPLVIGENSDNVLTFPKEFEVLGSGDC
jgi:hypothetical protein